MTQSQFWYVLNIDRVIVGGSFDKLEDAKRFANKRPDYFVISNVALNYL